MGVPENILPTSYADLVSDQSFNKQYHPKQTDLASALEKDVEICIHGSYYALSNQVYQKWASKYWGINYIYSE